MKKAKAKNQITKQKNSRKRLVSKLLRELRDVCHMRIDEGVSGCDPAIEFIHVITHLAQAAHEEEFGDETNK